jgi:small neutral amino acid transporter SnatA (MarC family)
LTSFGVLLVILGVGSLILPYLNIEIEFLDSVQPWAGVIVASVGLITVLFGSRRRPAEAAATATATVPPAAPAAPAAAPTATAAAPAAAPDAPDDKPWPTDPPERSDDD